MSTRLQNNDINEIQYNYVSTFRFARFIYGAKNFEIKKQKLLLKIHCIWMELRFNEPSRLLSLTLSSLHIYGASMIWFLEATKYQQSGSRQI